MTAAAIPPATPSWARPVGRRERRTDAVVAAALLAASAVTIPLFASGTAAPRPPVPVDVVWALLVTLPLAVRRVLPGTAASVVTAAFIAGQALGVPEELVGQVALVLALFTVGAWSADRRRAGVVRVALIAALLVWMTVGLVGLAAHPDRLPDGLPFASVVAISLLTNAGAFTATFLFGETAWQSAGRLAALEARTAELGRERERTTRQAVALERVRIARELHDVVAHHVSVMGLQAGAARLSLPGRPERAAAALGEVEENARHAVDELHRLVHALREEEDPGSPADAASTVGVDRIPDLVAESRRAGVATRFAVDGTPRRLSPVVGTALYRVAQEALTNVRRHAGAGAEADVRLVWSPDAVALEVADSRGAASPPSTGGGLGQVGMRERLDAVGGDLTVGPVPGGYAVRARVPVRPA